MFKKKSEGKRYKKVFKKIFFYKYGSWNWLQISKKWKANKIHIRAGEENDNKTVRGGNEPGAAPGGWLSEVKINLHHWSNVGKCMKLFGKPK